MQNAGDAALLWATIQQLAENFPEAEFSLAMNLPSTFPDAQSRLADCEFDTNPILLDRSYHVVGSFLHWGHRYWQGSARWHILELFWLVIVSLVWGGIDRVLPGVNIRSLAKLQLLSEEKFRLIRAYSEADLVVSVAGNFLYHSGKLGLTLLINLFSIWFAVYLGKPVYIFPQSIGPFKRKWELALTKRVLSKARIVMVREAESLQTLQSSNFHHPNLTLIPDVAFAFQPCSSQAALEFMRNYGIAPAEDGPLLGVTTINWMPQTLHFSQDKQFAYEASILEACRYFLDRTHGKVVLFNQVSGLIDAAMDSISAERIFRNLAGYSDQVVYINREISPGLLKAVYGQMDFFLGTRMHSNIFALSQGIPVLAVSYRYKTIGLMKSMDLEAWVLSIHNLATKEGSEQIVALMGQLIDQADVLGPKIRARSADFILQCQEAGKLVAKNYKMAV